MSVGACTLAYLLGVTWRPVCARRGGCGPCAAGFRIYHLFFDKPSSVMPAFIAFGGRAFDSNMRPPYVTDGSGHQFSMSAWRNVKTLDGARTDCEKCTEFAGLYGCDSRRQEKVSSRAGSNPAALTNLIAVELKSPDEGGQNR